MKRVSRRRSAPKRWRWLCPRASSLLACLACLACGETASVSGEPEHALQATLWERLAQDGDFHRMGKPMAGDWLLDFPEREQTYEQWVRSRPNRPHPRRQTIYLQPLGALGTAGKMSPALPTLARYVELYFGLPVRTLPSFPVDELKARSRINAHTGKRQLNAEDILHWMRTWVPDDAYAVVALTSVDLYPDDEWNFIFGLGSFVDRVGVYSLARYHASFYGEGAKDVPAQDAQVLRRTLKIMSHELGHTFGFRHCTHFECVMNGSNSLGETDRRPMHLCPLELRKLQAATSFDLPQRYRALSRFYRDNGLENEAAWAAAQALR